MIKCSATICLHLGFFSIVPCVWNARGERVPSFSNAKSVGSVCQQGLIYTPALEVSYVLSMDKVPGLLWAHLGSDPSSISSEIAVTTYAVVVYTLRNVEKFTISITKRLNCMPIQPVECFQTFQHSRVAYLASGWQRLLLLHHK